MTLAHPLAVPIMAALLALATTWVVRRAALALGFVDRPNPIIPQHTLPTAYGGGLAVALAAAAALALGAPAPPLRLWLPAVLFVALGLYDDAARLSPMTKFLLQSVVGTFAVFLGVEARFTGLGLLDAALSALIVLAWVNAANFTDVCDGLLAGLGALGLAGLALLPAPYAVLGAAVAGALVGFLAFNRPPASIFLGDAGSHLVGFLLAALGVELIAQSSSRLLTLTQVTLFAAVPLFELVFLTVVRVAKGLPWWRGSPDHFSLRLQAAGFSRWATDLLAWVAAALGALAALALPGLSVSGRALTLAALALLALGAGFWLKRHEVPPKEPTPQESATAGR